MIRPVVVGLLVCLPLSMAGLERICAAQDEGPLLPGLESSAAEAPTSASETVVEPVDVPPAAVSTLPADDGTIGDSPVDDGIAPLDADGIPQSGPGIESRLEPQLVLPDPPGLEPVPNVEPLQEAPRKKNLWQKSTDKIRTLTSPEPKADEPVKEKSATPSWQLLRRTPPEAGKPEVRQSNPSLSDPNKSSKSVQAERARQQQLQLQQQRLQQQRLEQQRQQQQRLQLQRQQQPRSQPQNVPDGPQSRWQSQQSPQQTYRAQPKPQSGNASNQVRSSQPSSSRRQVQGTPRPQYQPQTQAPRPQQGQKQRRTVDPRSAANAPHAPWDMQATPSSKPGVTTRSANTRSRANATQTVRAPQGGVVPR